MNLLKTKIIEFIGLPRTGKTTTAKKLQEHIISRGYSCYLAQNHKNNPVKDKLHPKYNYWAAECFIKEYARANERNCDYLIADRGLLDSAIWIKLLSDKLGEQHLYTDYIKKFKKWLAHGNYLNTFYFTADIGIVLERDKHTREHKGQNRIMNEAMLLNYEQAYGILKEQSLFPVTLKEFNTTKVSLDDTFEYVLSSINLKTRPYPHTSKKSTDIFLRQSSKGDKSQPIPFKGRKIIKRSKRRLA